MVKVDFKVIDPDTPEYLEVLRLREEILLKPLGLSFSSFPPGAFDKDKEGIQVIGSQDNQVVATALLVPEGKDCKMQRVAVKTEFQNSGVGSRMMEFCEEQAKIFGFTSIYCHARDKAVNFYLKNGYQPEGDYFEEHTIPHLKMKKPL